MCLFAQAIGSFTIVFESTLQNFPGRDGLDWSLKEEEGMDFIIIRLESLFSFLFMLLICCFLSFLSWLKKLAQADFKYSDDSSLDYFDNESLGLSSIFESSVDSLSVLLESSERSRS